jgi:hypothetical protein
MPNNPLSTFRAVEPPFAGFQAAAGLASVPFVLSWCKTSLTGAAGTATGTLTHLASTGTTTIGQGWDLTNTPTGITVDVDRAIPWLAREKSEIYPAAIPNAYDRVYIFPLYIIEGTTAGATLTPPLTTATHTGPSILPFGLLPGTRGAATAAALNDRGTRFPDDLIASQAAPLRYDYSTRTNGSWIVLPPYASNFMTNNAATVTNNESLPGSGARITTNTANGTLGLGYRFNSDYTISKSAGLNGTAGQPTASGNARFAASSSLTGSGMEFSLQGTQELVVVPQGFPSTLTWTTAANAEPFRVHMFMMGVFLG